MSLTNWQNQPEAGIQTGGDYSVRFVASLLIAWITHCLLEGSKQKTKTVNVLREIAGKVNYYTIICNNIQK